MRILMVGDVFGKAGRRTFAKCTARLKQEKLVSRERFVYFALIKFLAEPLERERVVVYAR